MRPIKFRAWNNIELDMIYEWWDLYEHGPNIYLMQFTGLLDKNGKEIYEGDIVKVADKSICVVDFHAGQFVFNITNPDPRTGGKRWCNESVYFNLQSEIIGNIYSNPEPLTPPSND